MVLLSRSSGARLVMQVRVATATMMILMAIFNPFAVMKKLMKSLMLFAAAAMAFTSCQNEEFNEGIEANETFTVNFVTDAPESRTSVSIEGGAANFAWGENEKFQFIQNTPGQTALTLGTGVTFANNAGKGEISATFTGDAATSYNFTAVYPAAAWVDGTDVEKSLFNSAKLHFRDIQNLVAGSFDPNADLLVSKKITGTPAEVSAEAQSLQFTRLVAIAEMNLKLLPVSNGEIITGVKFAVSDGTLAGRSYVDLATGKVVEYGYFGKTGTITLTNSDGIEANSESVKVYFTCIPSTIKAGVTYTVTVTTDKAVYTQSSQLTKDLTFEAGKVKAFGVNMEDAGVESNKSLAGDYIIVAKRSSGNFFYMTPNVGTASTKRFQAVDTGTTETDAIEMNENYKWTVKESDNAYTIASPAGTEITWTSGNSANLAATGKDMIIEKVNNANYYTISLADDATRKLGLNNTSGNNYFAFYTGTQMHNIYLIPFAVDERYEQYLSFGEITEFTITMGEDFTAPELTGVETGVVSFTSSNTAVATVDASTGAVTIVGTGTTTITAMAEGDEDFKPATASYTLQVLPTGYAGTGAGTAEDPYDVTRALDIIKNGAYTTNDVYTKGIISSIKSIDTGSYGNAEYSISVDGTTTNELIVYRGYYLNGNKFTSTDQIQVSDEVVVCGELTNYNGTYEYTSGSKIVSIKSTKLVMSEISCTNEAENEDSLTFSWTAVENAIGYEITFDNTLVGTIEATTYTATGLAAGTSHTISVKAVADGVNYKTSEAKTCTANTKAAEGVVAANIVVPFKKASMTTSVSSYTSSWDYTYNGTTLTLANFNNNNKGWDYVKCGRKNTASTGTITTKNAIEGTVSSVTVSVSACTADKVKSTYLQVATDAKFSNIIETVNATIKTGEVSYNISNPGSNYFYRLVFDCASGSSNGLVTITQVSYK